MKIIESSIYARWFGGLKDRQTKARIDRRIKRAARGEYGDVKGAAESIRIENGSITPNYIRYLWVRQQNMQASKIIYIPTEAGLPILEAKGENRHHAEP